MSNFDLDKYRSIGGFVRGGTPKFGSVTRADLLANCKNMDSPISQMVKDKVMYRNIKNGNPSDRLLKKDAELIQTVHHKKIKSEEKKRIWKKANESVERYKRRYHTDPI